MAYTSLSAIVASVAAVGALVLYLRRVHYLAKRWKYEDLPRLDGKVMLVTGANVGLGYETALQLAKRGAKVYITARSEVKGKAALATLKAQLPPTAHIELGFVDLASFLSINQFVKWFGDREDHLDVLVDNAGVFGLRHTIGPEGIELQFATNHVGTFLLTMQLLPFIEKAARQNGTARIVVVSSDLHYLSYPGTIRFDNINAKDGYDGSTSYSQSKAANVLFTKELARRLAGKNILVNACTPGMVATDIANKHELPGLSGASMPLMTWLFARTVNEGARVQTFLAGSPEVERKNYRGEYFKTTDGPSSSSQATRDPALAKKLWDFTEGLIKGRLGTLPYAPLV